MKPRIKRVLQTRDMWACFDDALLSFGRTPAEAYWSWKMDRAFVLHSAKERRRDARVAVH